MILGKQKERIIKKEEKEKKIGRQTSEFFWEEYYTLKFERYIIKNYFIAFIYLFFFFTKVFYIFCIFILIVFNLGYFYINI